MAGSSGGATSGAPRPHVLPQKLTVPLLVLSQRGKEEYKLAATSDGNTKAKKGKGQKDMDDLKKEVDLVSTRSPSSSS